MMARKSLSCARGEQRGGSQVSNILDRTWSSVRSSGASSSRSDTGEDSTHGWRPRKSQTAAAYTMDQQQFEVFVLENSVWRDYLRRRKESEKSEPRKADGHITISGPPPKTLERALAAKFCESSSSTGSKIAAQLVEPAVGASNRTVLHAGRGGAGWRKETAGCTGRRSKCKVRRSNACSLCSTASAMVFILDGECIMLSAKSMLNIKGARVELVQPDGMHLWLWNVASDALCSVKEAFARIHQAGAV
jgi:hypothetical protein